MTTAKREAILLLFPSNTAYIHNTLTKSEIKVFWQQKFYPTFLHTYLHFALIAISDLTSEIKTRTSF